MNRATTILYLCDEIRALGLGEEALRRLDAVRRLAAALAAEPEETARGRMVVEFAVQPDGHGGWDVMEPVSALCVCECPTEADARIAAWLRAVGERVKP